MKITALFLLLSLIISGQKSYSQTTVDPIQGRWVVTARNCSSGVPARDGFRIGRDEAKMSFFGGKYDGVTKIDGCNYWMSGKYETRGHMLRFSEITSASNCGNPPVAINSTFFFVVEEGLLKIYFPVNYYSESCPRGDMLEAVYTLSN